MDIDIKYAGDTANVVIDGNIDSIASGELSDKLQEVTDNLKIKNITIDLKGVKTINSAGIGKLLKIYKHYDGQGGSFKIIHISEKLMALFKEINLDKIIPISS
jgi:anti-anti-sigma factor